MTWNRLKASLPLLGLGLALHASTAFANATRLTFADVENIALQHFPGASIHQIERDNELGRAAFEVDLRTAEESGAN